VRRAQSRAGGKRIERIWWENGLAVPARKRRERVERNAADRPGGGPGGCEVTRGAVASPQLMSSGSAIVGTWTRRQGRRAPDWLLSFEAEVSRERRQPNGKHNPNLGARPEGLQLDEVGELAPSGQQLLPRSGFTEPSFVEHVDEAASTHRSQTMCDDESRQGPW
jgi:hypothetical protein